MVVGYKLRMSAYCGMGYTIAEGDEADVRKAAARFLRRRREDGNPISVLEKGEEWEIESPEDAVMVADTEGILHIDEVHAKTVECRECGCEVVVGETCSCFEPFEENVEEDADGDGL